MAPSTKPGKKLGVEGQRTGTGLGPSRDAGFTYVTALILTALVASLGGVLAQGWQVAAQREKEADLLFAGNQLRTAIGNYYTRKGLLRKLPPSLEDLLKDQRGATPAYHLRRLYADPFTGAADWELVTAPDGSVLGVHSRSTRRPLKTSNFDSINATFEGKATYAEWIFTYQVPASAPAQ